METLMTDAVLTCAPVFSQCDQYTILIRSNGPRTVTASLALSLQKGCHRFKKEYSLE
jgi:hypothetical protein